ncbi:MAG: hypothetical protein KAW12_07160 [Candidatus Aminicenantes bacterium]|nr:hypothetical protein [Candidatus Aminicenantes bacterium]
MKLKNTEGTTTRKIILFRLIVFLCTVISVRNGFVFIQVIFGGVLAVMIGVVVEIGRLTGIFLLWKSKGLIRILSVILYMATAGACVFFSITAFSLEIVSRENTVDQFLREQVARIKAEYSRKAARELAAIDEEIYKRKNKVAYYPGNRYWQKKLEQSVTQRGEIATKRDGFLAEKPTNLVLWIEEKTALLNLQTVEIPQQENKVIDATNALQNTWGLSKKGTQKITGIIVTTVLELVIFLLGFMSVRLPKKVYPDKNQKEEKQITTRDFFRDLFAELSKEFSRDEIKGYFAAAKKYYEQHKKLPAKREFPNNVSRKIHEFIKRWELQNWGKLLSAEGSGARGETQKKRSIKNG